MSERKHLISSKMNWKGDEEICTKDVCYFILVFFKLFYRKGQIEAKILGKKQGFSIGQSLTEGKQAAGIYVQVLY